MDFIYVYIWPGLSRVEPCVKYSLRRTSAIPTCEQGHSIKYFALLIPHLYIIKQKSESPLPDMWGPGCDYALRLPPYFMALTGRGAGGMNGGAQPCTCDLRSVDFLPSL